ncbi:MAG: hypothetical protein P8X74_19675 [Reinekea sp.]
MDRFNSPYHNNEHYYDHYYNQAYQEDGQHTFQPETGQTSAGAAASGAWGSHPVGNYPVPGQSYNYYSQEHYDSQAYQQGGQHTFQPEMGQTSVGGAASGMWGSHPVGSYPVPGQSYNYYSQEHYDHYHSQAYQEGGQHTFQPETGQTSAGVAANGAWGSYPEQGLDLNRPAQTPSWPWPDWGTTAPTTVADISQNVALPESFNPQPAAPERRGRPVAEGNAPVKERILAGLENYAQGVLLANCSATITFRDYFTDKGVLRPAGKKMCNGLSAEELALVNDALLRRSERHLKQAMDNAPVEERFLAGLENYAQGVRLRDCSATLQFRQYVTDNGFLHPHGKALRKSLPQEDQNRIDWALLRRSDHYLNRTMHKAPVEERFLAGIDNYANGLKLNKCAMDLAFRSYVTEDGRLTGSGHSLYNSLSRDDKERVDKALTARGKMYAQYIAKDVAKFMATLEPYGNGLSLQECGRKSGLKAKTTLYLTPEGGLTYKGQRLIENLQPDQLNKVLEVIEKRQQYTELNSQVPEPEWQWPENLSPISEMEAMQTEEMQTEAMQTEAMQTEAMWASVWQLTGQAVPGPSGSAAPPIPDYDSEAIGADFQHQYGSYGLPRRD